MAHKHIEYQPNTAPYYLDTLIQCHPMLSQSESCGLISDLQRKCNGKPTLEIK